MDGGTETTKKGNDTPPPLWEQSFHTREMPEQDQDVEATEKSNDTLPPLLAQGFHARAIRGTVGRVYDYYDFPSCCLALETPTGMQIKANHGIDAKFVEHPAHGKSLLYHDVSRNLPIIIYNAAEDERYCQDPLVVGPPFVRFFIGVPIMISPTMCIGTLCLMDTEKKAFYSLRDCEHAMQAAREIVRYFMESGRTSSYWTCTLDTLGTLPSLNNLPPMACSSLNSLPSTPYNSPPATPRSCAS